MLDLHPFALIGAHKSGAAPYRGIIIASPRLLASRREASSPTNIFPAGVSPTGTVGAYTLRADNGNQEKAHQVLDPIIPFFIQ
ncbi:MAG: hypothetical protein ACOX7C_07710 [Brevefilum sp.]